MDLSGAAWRKSSRSGNNGGQCVEVAAIRSSQAGVDVLCAVRDSKNPGTAALVFGRSQWQDFTTGIKAGRFDLP